MTEEEAEVVGSARRVAEAVKQLWGCHDLKGDLQLGLRRAHIDLVDAVEALDGDAPKKLEPNGCGARRQGTAGGNEPADCNWPMCGCDEYANRVIEVLDECGHLRTAEQH